MFTCQYGYLGKPNEEDGIRLYSMEDLVVMKLSAIVDNGSRLKDFVDIAFLSTRYSFYSMLELYARKFPDTNIIRVIKSVTYFAVGQQRATGQAGHPAPQLRQLRCQ